MREHRIAISRAGAARAVQFYRAHIKAPPARFLDIACGFGETVKAFEREGYDAFGIDADVSTKSHHNKISAKTAIGQIESVDLQGPVDIVHISHAVYFITEPMAFLTRVRDLLADDGIFCVTNADFTFWRDGGLPNEHHTFCPTATSMRAALALAGFYPISEIWVAGSIYVAARKCDPYRIPVDPWKTWLHWRTKRLRYAFFGAPVNSLRNFAGRFVGR